MPPSPQEISCQQVLVDEDAVHSVQWMLISGKYGTIVTPRFLFERYLAYLRSVTCTLIRPTETDSSLEFRLAGTTLSLLSFTPPQTDESGCSLSLAICGGFLVQPDSCNRGRLSFVVEPEGGQLKVMLHLADYCPLLLGGPRPSLLRRWLYRFTQALIHRKVTISFLARLYREIAGEDAPLMEVRVRPERGRET